VTNFLAIGIFFLGTLFKRDWIIDLSLIVFFVNLIGTIISSIVQIVIRKWYYIFPQLGLAAFLFYYTVIIFTYSPPDYYAADKEIPENIDFSEPLDSLPTIKDFEKYDLILSNYAQPGIYKYYTDYQPKETGYFYIKAFEITSNDRLSGDRMEKRSKAEVDNLKPQKRNGEFTIYEGNWGEKYGSRIELWYQPSNGQEYKIEERNFIVEGWQR
tara:strand:- start:962 stop:1600 length:639 start_codon:yes stop_codon:yes gene_type:complete